MTLSERSFTCPNCGALSYHLRDIEDGSCSRCHYRAERSSAATDEEPRQPLDYPLPEELVQGNSELKHRLADLGIDYDD